MDPVVATAVVTPIIAGLLAAASWVAKNIRNDRVADKKKIDDLQAQIYQMQADRIKDEIDQKNKVTTEILAGLETLLRANSKGGAT